MAPEKSPTAGAAAELGRAGGEIERSEGQWVAVWSGLRRNRLAMAGITIVLFLLAIAVGADFLANDKP